MALDKSLPLAERQSLAAKRTHGLRHKATESKIRAACRGLQERGEKLTQASIASLAGVSRQTVATYGHVLNEVSRPQTIAVLSTTKVTEMRPNSNSVAGDQGLEVNHATSQARLVPDVKNGVHQITARFAAALDLAVEGSESDDSS
ncbi:hypothetical protein ATY02_13905 [Pseudomonas sp. BIOMIG1BAC]|nr:hypothetical protein ATY02_13905 [Pseudomonas sp. BIOMIG1BAC]